MCLFLEIVINYFYFASADVASYESVSEIPIKFDQHVCNFSFSFLRGLLGVQYLVSETFELVDKQILEYIDLVLFDSLEIDPHKL